MERRWASTFPHLGNGHWELTWFHVAQQTAGEGREHRTQRGWNSNPGPVPNTHGTLRKPLNTSGLHLPKPLNESVCLLSCFSCVQLVATLWTVTCQPPLSMGFSRQEFWSGLPCPSPGDLPNPGTELASLKSPALAGRFFTTSTTWEALNEEGVVGFIYLFLAIPHSMRDLSSPDQRLNPCPLQWKHGVLTTGLPGKSRLLVSLSTHNVVYVPCIRPLLKTKNLR